MIVTVVSVIGKIRVTVTRATRVNTVRMTADIFKGDKRDARNIKQLISFSGGCEARRLCEQL
jgi:hypothetical protein